MTIDVIVVGARCAGSPTAMLLARKGYRVLVVDRTTFPSDTISSHVLQPMAVSALSRWDLLDRLRATDCPPVHTYAYDFGPLTLSGSPGTTESPSRISLDEPFSTSCWSMPRLRPGRRFVKGSPSTTSS